MGVSGSTAVLLALIAGASAAGSWCAAVGLPWLGAAAAAELGVALERLALVRHPGREWAGVVAAFLDGFDVVSVAVPARLRAGDARRLSARARERGAVLVAVGDWPGADVRVRAGPSRWTGLGEGCGRLQSRYVPVAVEGRAAAARPRHGRLWLAGGVLPEPGPGPGPGLGEAWAGADWPDDVDLGPPARAPDPAVHPLLPGARVPA